MYIRKSRKRRAIEKSASIEQPVRPASFISVRASISHLPLSFFRGVRHSPFSPPPFLSFYSNTLFSNIESVAIFSAGAFLPTRSNYDAANIFLSRKYKCTLVHEDSKKLPHLRIDFGICSLDPFPNKDDWD